MIKCCCCCCGGGCCFCQLLVFQTRVCNICEHCSQLTYPDSLGRLQRHEKLNRALILVFVHSRLIWDVYHKIMNHIHSWFSEGSRHLIPQDAFEGFGRKKLHPASPDSTYKTLPNFWDLYLGVLDAPHSNSVTTTYTFTLKTPWDDGGASLKIGGVPAGLKGYVGIMLLQDYVIHGLVRKPRKWKSKFEPNAKRPNWLEFIIGNPLHIMNQRTFRPGTLVERLPWPRQLQPVGKGLCMDVFQFGVLKQPQTTLTFKVRNQRINGFFGLPGGDKDWRTGRSWQPSSEIFEWSDPDRCNPWDFLVVENRDISKWSFLIIPKITG